MRKIKTSGSDSASTIQFPIVGIGASAGGLDAIKKFLQAVPKNSGMAYVFVQHLSPTHESLLPGILEKFSKIPVVQITDNIHLEQDKFYVIPANKIVTAEDGVLKLEELDGKYHKIKVIDVFFSSLAVVHQSYAVGVVLSGSLDDGALGLQVIKSYGGITYAQNGNTAAYDSMPKSAINTGAVDFVLPPQKIVESLITINSPFHPDHPAKAAGKNALEKDEDIFRQILTILRVRRGIDFSYYKKGTLKRRIVRRMALQKIERPEEYLVYLRENKSEQNDLYNDLLISVTHFFRDPAAFELLCDTILPALSRQKTKNEAFRIWIAGCATGEEAYSMAICIQEHLGEKAADTKVQIFATDVSEPAIKKARSGLYRANELSGLSETRLQQFFTKTDDNYQVNRAIRDMCVFATHNFLKDPPFSKIDLVSCRNVLIYFEPVLQKRALNTFHYALNEAGFLMLGKSESIGNHTDLFTSYNSHEKIFSRTGDRGRIMSVTTALHEQKFQEVDKNERKEAGKQDVFKIAEDIIISNYAPACVLVNERFDIIQFFGDTQVWITLPTGRASLNLLKMAREGLAFELRNLLHLAKKTKAPVKKDRVLFYLKEEEVYADLEVSPLPDALDPYYLVLFSKSIPDIKDVPGGAPAKNKRSRVDPKDLVIEQLKKELMQVRSDMRGVTEEQEAVNEELQSSNEELLSGSEELQSLNEELETSKEELQSTNEEIIIVNSELVNRNEQLNHARSYAEGIINTIRDPLLVLDRDLKVLRATRGFYHKFKVSENETVNQYIYELGNGQWNIPALREMLEKIIPETNSFADFEVKHTFPSIGQKVMLLNGQPLDKINSEQVILLAIEDVTDHRKVEDGMAEVEKLFRENQDRLKLAVDAAQMGTWENDLDTEELILDKRAKVLFDILPGDTLSYPQYLNQIQPDERKAMEQAVEQALAGINNGEFEQEFAVKNKTGKELTWIKSNGKAHFNEHGVAVRFVGTWLDITVQKNIEKANVELLKKKDDFMSIASHELKTPITTLKASIQLLDRLKDEPAKIPASLIERANKSMDKINTLIDGLLDVTKISHGRLQLKKTTFILSELVEECCEQILFEGKYEIKVTGDADAAVYADRERIEQVINNLVNNAIKYAKESKEIVIQIEKLDDCVKVCVIDGGPGVAADKLTHLFERYYQADDHDNSYTGLGLGLFISSEIIKQHGGEIGVESKVGKGCSFWFTLPV